MKIETFWSRTSQREVATKSSSPFRVGLIGANRIDAKNSPRMRGSGTTRKFFTASTLLKPGSANCFLLLHLKTGPKISPAAIE
jgi:hypothetical protein